MSNLANQLAAQEQDEIGRAVRTLLAHPLLTVRQFPEEFDLVRRRRGPLTAWFDYYCGWRLLVEPRLGYARLIKVTATVRADRPARRIRAGRAPFDRRRYTLLCVTAAELLATPVTTIGLLADRVAQACHADPDLPPFDTAVRGERMAFVDGLQWFEHGGVLEALDGTSDSFVESAESKVLYRVDTTALLRLSAAPVPPAQVQAEPHSFEDRLESLRVETRYHHGDPVSPQRTLWLRHSVFRALLDDPVVHRADLSEEQLAYASSPTGRQLIRRAAAEARFVLEERAEGLLYVDPDAVASDGRFPSDADHAKVAALILLDALTAAPSGELTDEQLRRAAGALLDRLPNWAMAYRDEGGLVRLTRDAVTILAGFDLVTVTGPVVTARPAAWRYRVTVPQVASPSRRRSITSIFDEQSGNQEALL